MVQPEYDTTHNEGDQAQDSPELFQSALDAIGDRIAILDGGGQLVWVNKAWRRFAARLDAPAFAAALPGANYLEVCRESAAEHQIAHDTLYGIYSVLEGLIERFALEYCFGEAANAIGWYRMTACLLRGVAGGLVVSHREITERKLAEQERDQLNLDLQLAMTNLHTLSTLLPVCGSCGTLRQDSPYHEQVRTYFAQHAEVGSFGICPTCHEKIFLRPPAAGIQALPPAQGA